MPTQEIDLTDSDAMREKFKDLSIKDLSALLREGLNELYCKIRAEEEFGYDVIISGKLDSDYSDVYITNAPSAIGGEARYTEMIKL